MEHWTGNSKGFFSCMEVEHWTGSSVVFSSSDVTACFTDVPTKAKLNRARRNKEPIVETKEEQKKRLFATLREHRAKEKRYKDGYKMLAAADKDETEWDDTKAVEPAKSKGKPPVAEVAIVTQFGRSGHASA